MEERPGRTRLSRRAFLRRALAFVFLSRPGPGLSKALASPPCGGIHPARLASPSPLSPLRAGAAVSRAGPLAAFGEATRKALILWHEQLVARAEASPTAASDPAATHASLPAPPVILEFVDDESRPEVAAERFADLARRVHIAVGPYGSQLAAAVLPVCREAGLPVLLPSAGDPDLELQADLGLQDKPDDTGDAPLGAPPLGFSLIPPNTESLTGALDWAASQGIRDVALFFRDDPFSRQVAQGARRRAHELGLRIAWDRTFSSAAEIWEVAVELEGERVGLLLGGGYTPGAEAAGFLPDAREIAIAFENAAEWKALLVAPTFPEFGRALGPRAEGILGNTNWKPWFPWPGNAEFVSAHKLRWGEEPDNHAAAAYAAGQLIEAAWRQLHLMGGASATSAEQELTATRLALRRALATLEMTTVFGPFAVDANGRQTAHRNFLLQWRGGRLRPL